MADGKHKHKFLVPLDEQMPADSRRKSKLIPLDEAGKIIASKKIFSIAGSHSADAAMSLIRAAIKAGAKGMTLIPPITTSMAADLPIAAGMLKKLYLSYVGFELFGMAPAFRKAAEQQTLDIVEADEPFILLGTQAAAGGKPFNAVQYLYDGTDHKKLNPELKQVVDPFTGRTVWAIPPLRADVFIMHAQVCDEYGNAQCWGGTGQERDKAKAADMVIVQADEIVGSDVIQHDPSKTTVPGLWVDHVVHAPFGAHPTFSSNNYAVDEAHIKLYIDMVKDGREKEYIDRFIREPKDHFEYLELVGGLRHLTGLRGAIATRS
jgi:glutaconate CoA-transferase, subunit A